MSKESVIQNMKEHLDYRNDFGKYLTSNKDYLLVMNTLCAPGIAEEYAKAKLKDLGLITEQK